MSFETAIGNSRRRKLITGGYVEEGSIEYLNNSRESSVELITGRCICVQERSIAYVENGNRSGIETFVPNG